MYKAFLLLLVIPLGLLAQEKKLEIDFKSPKSSMGMYDTYSFVNKERDKVCILAIGGTIIRGYVLTKDYVLLKEFSAVKTEARRQLVGGYFRDDKIHYLLARNEDDDEIDHYTYDPVTDINLSNPVDLQIKKSMFLGGLSLGDQFLFVTVKKKEDKIMVYRFGANIAQELLQFDYPGSALDRESLHYAFSKESGFSRESEMSYINDWEFPSIARVKNYCKMYQRNDSLIITIDREKNTIYVLELDLKAKKISGRKIARDFNFCLTEFQSSSFLLDGYLYSVVCCRDMLQLSVYDFYDGKLIRDYRTERDQEISFRSTDIIQEGSDFASEGERKLEKTRQLLRKMTNGRATIVARNVDDATAELTVGSYQEVRSGGGGMWMGGAGPGSAPVYMTGGFSREWTKSARFKTLLNKNSFEKTTGEIEKPLEDRIETYTKNIKIPGGCEGIYPAGKKLVYYYLDRREGKLVITAL
jgi:hypothetical protein